MNWIEILIVSIGISLDLFAAVECQGALVAKIHAKHLILITLLVSSWQLAILYLGNFGATLLCSYNIGADKVVMERIISVTIFFFLGLRLLFQAWKNEQIDERREEELGVRRFFRLVAVTSFYTFVTGAAFGFLGTSVILLLAIVLAITVVCVVAGMYTGYHLGYEPKTKVYIVGGILLIVAGIEIILRYVA